MSMQSKSSNASDEEGGKLLNCPDEATMHTRANLLSERKRRIQFNELLYALRSVVPIVTKLDKTSIINDTITYLQQLKQKVKDMENDVSILENEKANILASTSDERLSTSTTQGMDTCKDSPKHKILELNVVNMGQKTYRLHICYKKDKEVLLQLSRALEDMDLIMETANFAAMENAQMLCVLVVKVGTAHNMTLTSEELKESILKSASVYGIRS